MSLGDADPFAAVADPTRRDLVRRLATEGPSTATALAAHLPITRQAVVKHLQVLSQARVVAASRVGREVRFRLRPEALAESAAWLAEVVRAWDARFEKLRRHLEEGEGDGEARRRGPEGDARAGGRGARVRRARDRRGAERVVHQRRRSGRQAGW